MPMFFADAGLIPIHEESVRLLAKEGEGAAIPTLRQPQISSGTADPDLRSLDWYFAEILSFLDQHVLVTYAYAGEAIGGYESWSYELSLKDKVLKREEEELASKKETTRFSRNL